jgi:hypothetical protein
LNGRSGSTTGVADGIARGWYRPPSGRCLGSVFMQIYFMLKSTFLSSIPLLLLAGCNLGAFFLEGESAEIWKQMKATEYKSIDFSVLAGQEWTKACFYGPYSETNESELGFKWRISEHTDVLASDGHNVIVFATDSKVVSFVVHSRAYGDFATLSGKCVARSAAQLVREPSGSGWKSYVIKG